MRQPDLKDLAAQVIERNREATAAERHVRELQRRLASVVSQLRKNPQLRYAFDVQDAPLRPEPGPPVSVVLALRTSCGIVSSELRVPRDKFSPGLFFETLERPQ